MNSFYYRAAWSARQAAPAGGARIYAGPGWNLVHANRRRREPDANV